MYYRWATSRHSEKLTAFLEGYEGLLQSDAYDAYVQFAADNEGVILVGCMAHMRRKFFDARDQHPRECALVLKLIARLYQVEKTIRETPIPLEQISPYRKKHALNSHRRLRRVLAILRHGALPESQLGKACAYALNHWTSMSRYLDYGQVAIDNNAMENAIRPTAIGKKNWMFVGHPQAGDRPAILYSILLSCQRLQIDINEYLQDVLSLDTRILDNEQLAELTPAQWKKARSN